MAKVLGIHEIEVHEGLSEASLKKAFREIAKQWEDITGWKMLLLKGDKGQRSGKYALIYEIKSVQEREHPKGMSTEEVNRWAEEHKDFLDDFSKKWAAISPTDTSTHEEYTDYIVLV
jgi:hypothetical protein